MQIPSAMAKAIALACSATAMVYGLELRQADHCMETEFTLPSGLFSVAACIPAGYVLDASTYIKSFRCGFWTVEDHTPPLTEMSGCVAFQWLTPAPGFAHPTSALCYDLKGEAYCLISVSGNGKLNATSVRGKGLTLPVMQEMTNVKQLRDEVGATNAILHDLVDALRSGQEPSPTLAAENDG